jgi:hypothetical protein
MVLNPIEFFIQDCQTWEIWRNRNEGEGNEFVDWLA